MIDFAEAPAAVVVVAAAAGMWAASACKTDYSPFAEVPGVAQQVGGTSCWFGSLDSDIVEELAEQLAVVDTASTGDAAAARSLRQCDEGTGTELLETKTCSGTLG